MFNQLIIQISCCVTNGGNSHHNGYKQLDSQYDLALSQGFNMIEKTSIQKAVITAMIRDKIGNHTCYITGWSHQYG